MDTWLDGFNRWRSGATTTAEWYDEAAEARRRIDQAREVGFTGRELMRLEIYRRAVAAGFFNEG